MQKESAKSTLEPQKNSTHNIRHVAAFTYDKPPAMMIKCNKTELKPSHIGTTKGRESIPFAFTSQIVLL